MPADLDGAALPVAGHVEALERHAGASPAARRASLTVSRGTAGLGLGHRGLARLAVIREPHLVGRRHQLVDLAVGKRWGAARRTRPRARSRCAEFHYVSCERWTSNLGISRSMSSMHKAVPLSSRNRMRILLTGSSGWLGQTLQAAADGRSATAVTGIDPVPSAARRHRRHDRRPRSGAARDRREPHRGDHPLRRAAQAGCRDAARGEDFLDVNMQGTFNLLEEAVRQRRVRASSSPRPPR